MAPPFSPRRRRTDRDRKRFPNASSALARPGFAHARILTEQPRLLAGLIGLMVLGAVLEAAGLVILLPLLAAMGIEGAGGGTGAVYAFFRDTFAAMDAAVTLPSVLALWVALLATLGFVRHGERVHGTALLEEYKLSLRARLFRAVARADWTFHLGSRPSDVQHSLTDEVTRVGECLRHGLAVTSGVLTAVAYLAVAVYLSPIATVLAVLSGVAVVGILRTRTDRSEAASQSFSGQVQANFDSVAELLGGMRTAKIHAEESNSIEGYDRSTRSLAEAWIATLGSESEAQTLLRIGLVVSLGLFLWVTIGLLGVGPATILVLTYALARLGPSLSKIREGMRSFASTSSAHGRLSSLLERAMGSAEPDAWRGAPTPPLKVGIRLDHVSLRPPEESGHGRSLHDVSLEITAYAVTAIVGPRDGGGRTIIDLITGIVSPESGEVLVDGRRLTGAALRGWRKRVGYVSPRASFSGGPVRSWLGLDGGGGRESDLQNALRVAQLEGFVAALPHGLSTVLGANRRLTVGERRRVALARALLRRPQLLVLDEATGVSDPEAQVFVSQVMRALRGKLTVVVATDHPAMAHEADWIHVIDGGIRVESGSWEQLSQREGRMQQLAAAQAVYGRAPTTRTN